MNSVTPTRPRLFETCTRRGWPAGRNSLLHRPVLFALVEPVRVEGLTAAALLELARVGLDPVPLVRDGVVPRGPGRARLELLHLEARDLEHVPRGEVPLVHLGDLDGDQVV